MQIWVEFALCLVLFFLWFYLDRLRLRSVGLGLTGWRQLLWGIFFLFLGSIADVSDNLVNSGRFLAIRNTGFLGVAKVGFYILGILLVVISPLNWLSALLDRRMKDEDERRREDFLHSLLSQLKNKATLPDLFAAALPEVIGFLRAEKGAGFLVSGQELLLSYGSGFSKEESAALNTLKMDGDALSWCVKNDKLKIVKTLSESEQTLAGLMRDERIRSLVCIPLSGRDRTLGVLAIFGRKEFEEEDVMALSSLGKDMGKMVEYIRCQAEIRVTCEKLDALGLQRELLLGLLNSTVEPSITERLNRIALKGSQLINANSCSLLEIDSESETAEIIASSDPASLGEKIVLSESREMKEVAQKGEIVFRSFEDAFGRPKSFLALPLFIQDQTFGGLVFDFKDYSPASTEVDIDSAKSLASFASLLLYHHRLSEKVQARKEEAKKRALRILAIEDQKTTGQLLEDMGSRLGYEIKVVPDARIGLENLERNSFDLVISESDMPGVMGWDVCRMVKSSRPDVLVTLIAEMPLPRHLTIKYGVDFVLIKPFTIGELVQIIEEAEKMKRQSPQGFDAR